MGATLLIATLSEDDSPFVRETILRISRDVLVTVIEGIERDIVMCPKETTPELGDIQPALRARLAAKKAELQEFDATFKLKGAA